MVIHQKVKNILLANDKHAKRGGQLLDGDAWHYFTDVRVGQVSVLMVYPLTITITGKSPPIGSRFMYILFSNTVFVDIWQQSRGQSRVVSPMPTWNFNQIMVIL